MGEAALVFRPVAPRVLSVVLGMFGLWGLVVEARDGQPRTAVTLAVGMLAYAAGAYALYWRPSVVVHDDGTLLRNVLRDVHVPWSCLVAVTTRFSLTLVTTEGTYRSWAASSSGARADSGMGDLVQVGGSGAPPDRSMDAGAAALMVRQRWDARRHVSAADAEVRVRPVLWPLGVAVAAALGLVGLLLTG